MINDWKHLFFVPIETEQEPVGLLVREAFLWPQFLACRAQTLAPMTFLKFQRVDLISC